MTKYKIQVCSSARIRVSCRLFNPRLYL